MVLQDCLGMLEGEEQLPDESDNLREVAPWQQAFAEGLVAARLRKVLLDKNPVSRKGAHLCGIFFPLPRAGAVEMGSSMC